MNILTVMKLAGIVVSGALGILGTITETRDKTTGRLTHWGKWALWLTVTGLGVALGSQLFENVQKEREEIALAQQTAKQSRAVMSMLTKFDQLCAYAVIELPSDDAVVTKFAEELNQLGEQDFEKGGKLQWPSGIYHSKSNIVSIRVDELQDEKLLREFMPIGHFLEVARSSFPSISIDRNEQTRKSAAPFPNEVDHDLRLGNQSKDKIFDLRYSLETHRFRFALTFLSNESNGWFSNGKVVGLSDLSGAIIELGFIFYPSKNDEAFKLFSSSRVVRCDLTLGKHFCTVTNLSRTVNQMDNIFISYDAMLPDVELIMNDKTYSFDEF